MSERDLTIKREREKERESSKYTKFNYIMHTVIYSGDKNGRFL
jgi:hypothetical protein